MQPEPWPTGPAPGPARFNPLRGRQTLQRRLAWGPTSQRPCFNPLRGRQTLQPWTGYALPGGLGCFNPLRGRQTLQPGLGFFPLLPSQFQSSTRQTDFATPYLPSRLGVVVSFQSSTRQTDFATSWPRAPLMPSPSRFNPLRGRQTLQLASVCSPSAWTWRFQSSTRQTDFAT